MAFRLPNFNLLGNVWELNNTPSAGPPDFTDVPCQLYYPSRGPWMGLPGNPNLYAPMAVIRSPAISLDVFGNANIWECPAGSGRYYVIRYKDNTHQGFPNEYNFHVVSQCDSSGLPNLHGIIAPPVVQPYTRIPTVCCDQPNPLPVVVTNPGGPAPLGVGGFASYTSLSDTTAVGSVTINPPGPAAVSIWIMSWTASPAVGLAVYSSGLGGAPGAGTGVAVGVLGGATPWLEEMYYTSPGGPDTISVAPNFPTSAFCFIVLWLTNSNVFGFNNPPNAGTTTPAVGAATNPSVVAPGVWAAGLGMLGAVTLPAANFRAPYTSGPPAVFTQADSGAAYLTLQVADFVSTVPGLFNPTVDLVGGFSDWGLIIANQ